MFDQIKDWIIPHTKRGFFCGDSSLSYPYKLASIPTEWLQISVYVVGVLVNDFSKNIPQEFHWFMLFEFQIWVIELAIEFLKRENEIKRKLATTSLRCLKWFIYYYVIFMLLMIFMTLLKNLVGGLRPIFLQLCQPDLAVNCSIGQFINSDFKCMNPTATEFTIFEIKRSFPSGHATASVYVTLFFMRYLEARFAKFRVTLSALHFSCSIWMVVCCVSRITEHFHHVGDVIAGIIIALPFVFYSVRKGILLFLWEEENRFFFYILESNTLQRILQKKEGV